MIREVNLIGHLPSYVQDYHEIQNIMNAENPELQSVEDLSETIKDNMFILHTDETGIERYEKMLGLVSSKNDSLSNRQLKVLVQYTNDTNYTIRALKEQLDIVCGVGNYSVELTPNEYKIAIMLHIRVGHLIEIVNSMLKNMIPANMIYTCEIKYNTYEVLSKYRHYQLQRFTHEELYSEPIEDILP